MYKKIKFGLATALIAAAPLLGQQKEMQGSQSLGSEDATTDQVLAPADRILQSTSNSDQHSLVSEALIRRPRDWRQPRREIRNSLLPLPSSLPRASHRVWRSDSTSGVPSD